MNYPLKPNGVSTAVGKICAALFALNGLFSSGMMGISAEKREVPRCRCALLKLSILLR